MTHPAEPVLRLPPRARRVESDAVLDRGLELVRGFRAELEDIRRESQSRINALEPGAGLFSFYTGLGSSGGGQYQDTQALPGTLALANSYFPITLNWTLLANSYMTQGLLRTVVDQIVDDAYGEGIEFESSQLSPEELIDLNRVFREQRDVESYAGTRAQKLNYCAGVDLSNSDLEACKLVGKWGRLFGGSGLIVNTTQPMNQQFRPEMIREDDPLTFIAADRWELVLDTMNAGNELNPIPYNYYGMPLHRSRVGRFVWAPAPSRIRLRLGGWGMSVLEESIRPVSAYLKFEKLIFELMDEAKVDVYKIRGFNALLATRAGTEALVQRTQAANQAKSFQNALTMDKEDDYEQKQLGSIFPGLASMYENLRVNLCAYMKIPMNKLFGQSAGGFSSGKDSLDNYNSTVRNFRTTSTPVVLKAGKLRCQQRFGIIPDDLSVGWVPLDILDGVEQETVKTSKQSRIESRFSLGLTTGPEALAEMRKEELITIEETEVEQGLRDVEPPLSQNPDEMEAGMAHEEKLAKTAAAAKPKPVAGGGRRP